MSEQIRDNNPPNLLIQFFGYEHLPKGNMQDVSQLFSILAHTLHQVLPRNPESTVAFRKLLEAKDCAVRATIFDFNK